MWRRLLPNLGDLMRPLGTKGRIEKREKDIYNDEWEGEWGNLMVRFRESVVILLNDV